jgi:hypothetical protein
MNPRGILCTVSTFVLLLMFTSTSVFAMSSSNYSSSGETTMGGGTRASSSYSAEPDVLGAIGGGEQTSASYAMQSGLLHALTDTASPVTTATPAGGTYSTAQSVILACDDNGGSGCFAIYYTTNNTAPTTLSSVYSAPVNVSVSTTVKYFAVDNDGNMEQVRTSVYTINDADPPVGTVSIDAGAAFTNKTSVTLTLTCNDAVSGCVQMKFSNDGASWDSAVSNTASYNWSLDTGEGSRTVYAQFKDNAGNWSTSVTDTIVLAPYEIAGTVINADGVAIPFALIKLKRADSAIMRMSFADAGGMFVEDYLTSGQYKLGASLIGHSFGISIANITGANASVIIKSQRSLWDGINDTESPNIPAALTAQALSDSEILLTWDTPVDNVSIAGFRVFDGGDTHIASSVTNRYLIKGLTAATEYCFKVSAFDGAGNESAKTSQQCDTTQ